jgi:hypothetical protein
VLILYVFYVVAAAIVGGLLLSVYRKSALDSPFEKLSRGAQNAELIKVLLNLEEEPLENLFNLYRQQFGDSAARYARNTYLKWKSGAVRPNKQTFRRFLINLPKVMNFDLKCEVLRELREEYCAREHYKLTVHTDDWKDKLTPLVESMIAKAKDAELPDVLKQRLTWLAEDDIEVANAILQRSQTRMSLDALSLLEKEFSNIERLLDNTDGRRRITHVLKLPLGTITLQIESN